MCKSGGQRTKVTVSVIGAETIPVAKNGIWIGPNKSAEFILAFVAAVLHRSEGIIAMLQMPTYPLAVKAAHGSRFNTAKEVGFDNIGTDQSMLVGYSSLQGTESCALLRNQEGPASRRLGLCWYRSRPSKAV